MIKKISAFLPLSVLSFCFFSIIFYAAAYAQESVSPDVSGKLAQEVVPATVLATPTVYMAQAKILPEITETSTITSTSSVSRPTISPVKLSAPIKTVVVRAEESKEIPTLKPTFIPVPSFTPTPTEVATKVEINLSVNKGMDAEKLFAMANSHRASIGAPALQKDDRTCSLAAERASEIAGEMAAGTLHSGMYNRNLPYWNTENAIAMGPEEAAFNWWLGDYIHRKAIENPSHTVSCVACNGVYCVQEFTSYVAK